MFDGLGMGNRKYLLHTYVKPLRGVYDNTYIIYSVIKRCKGKEPVLYSFQTNLRYAHHTTNLTLHTKTLEWTVQERSRENVKTVKEMNVVLRLINIALRMLRASLKSPDQGSGRPSCSPYIGCKRDTIIIHMDNDN